MLKANSYTLSGTKSEDVNLGKEYFVSDNLFTIAQAVRVLEVNSHPGLSKTKTRSEVNRTTKKWFKQKGTGRARHGARSAPIFVGGGTAHGPKNLKKVLKISQPQGNKALKSLIALKVKENQAVVVKGFSGLKKTSQVEKMLETVLKALKIKRQNVAFVFSSENKEKRMYSKNIKNSNTYLFDNLNVLDVYKAGFLFFDADIFKKATLKKEKEIKNEKH